MQATHRRTRVLLVADWSVDPHAVVAAASRRAESEPSAFTLVVPAWLHGLDWAGDPHASVPCAQRQVVAVHALLAGAGLDVRGATVGDPDPASAICDALDEWPADEVLLCARPRHLPGTPLDVTHRARRISGLPVQRVEVRPAPARASCHDQRAAA